MAANSRTYRDALGHFATGVAVVSGLSEKLPPFGTTISSFSSVSLEPRIVLFSLKKDSPSLQCFSQGRPFAISVLGLNHRQYSGHFATPSEDKWRLVEHVTWDYGCPIVAGSLAAFEGTIHSRVEVGDHAVLFGEVERLAANPHLEPLLYFRGGYREVLVSGDSLAVRK